MNDKVKESLEKVLSFSGNFYVGGGPTEALEERFQHALDELIYNVRREELDIAVGIDKEK